MCFEGISFRSDEVKGFFFFFFAHPFSAVSYTLVD